MVLLMAFLWVTVDALVEQIYLHQSSSQKIAGEVRYNTAYKSQYHGRNVFL